MEVKLDFDVIGEDGLHGSHLPLAALERTDDLVDLLALGLRQELVDVEEAGNRRDDEERHEADRSNDLKRASLEIYSH